MLVLEYLDYRINHTVNTLTYINNTRLIIIVQVDFAFLKPFRSSVAVMEEYKSFILECKREYSILMHDLLVNQKFQLQGANIMVRPKIFKKLDQMWMAKVGVLGPAIPEDLFEAVVNAIQRIFEQLLQFPNSS